MSKNEMAHRVLFLDDEMVYRLMVEHLFKHFYPDLELISVSEADELFQVLSDGDVDILILDVNLPIQSGWELLDDVKEFILTSKRMKPFVVMSSSSIGFDEREKAKSNPFVDAYIEKPMNHEKLMAMMEAHAKE